MAKKSGKRQQPKYGLFEFLIGGLFSVGLPALMTAIAPVSWLEFNRVEERVTAKAQTCLLFVIPYRTQELTDVKEVTTTFKLGDMQHRRRGDNNQGRAESQGSVALHGPKQGEADGEIITVSVSPASTALVETKIKGFLADPQQKSLSVFTVANWKVGVIFAIPASLLTVLFVIGWSIWLGQTLAKPFQFRGHNEQQEGASDTEASNSKLGERWGAVESARRTVTPIAMVRLADSTAPYFEFGNSRVASESAGE